jgi:hypothetical protein
MSICNVVGSYTIGCIATASRTVFDWIAVDASFETIELAPYIQFYMEYGCIEWLGFSTCETVQFKEWMEIYTMNEEQSVTLFNVTNTNSQAPTFSAMAPIDFIKGTADGGSISFGGQLILALGSKMVPKSTEAFASKVTIPDLLSVSAQGNKMSTVGSVLTTVPVSSLLASKATTGGLIYMDLGPTPSFSILNVPAKGTYFKHYAPRNLNDPFHRRYAVKGLLYYTNIGGDIEKCGVSQSCAASCVWSSACEPLPYGHMGMLMPSSSFWLDYSAYNGIGHWPMVPWNYADYVVKEDETAEPPKTLTIINPETFLLSEYENTGLGTVEKLPGVEVWLWRHVKFLPTCGVLLNAAEGKDCDAPANMISVDFVGKILPASFNKILYASLPVADDGAKADTPEISSEIVSGLKIDFTDSYQMNALLRFTNGNTETKVRYPLFWILRAPGGTASITNNMNKDYTNYAKDMLVIEFVAWMLYILFFGIVLFMTLWGMTCIDYMKNVEANYTMPVYI